MSVVKFLCPNGHQLNAPVDLVGKKGKCPKCGTAFVVPAPVPEDGPETPTPTPASSGSSKQSAEASGSAPRLDIKLGSGIKPGPGSKPNQDIFVFLCPNGHKLNGPPTLKGKLGQCPHCGAKFRIPEDEPEPEVVEGAEIVDEPPPETEAVEEISPDQLEIEEPEPPFTEGVHPLAHIIGRLWYHKGEDGELELLLPEGELMQPEYFSPSLSARDYGVFATREGHGYSFSVIPWANVRRVNVHKVEHLPPGAFPE